MLFRRYCYVSNNADVNLVCSSQALIICRAYSRARDSNALINYDITVTIIISMNITGVAGIAAFAFFFFYRISSK